MEDKRMVGGALNMERFAITMTSDAFPDPEDAYAIWDNKYDSYHYDADDRCVTFANEADATAYLEQLNRESTMIRFVDSNRNELFSVPDGSNVTITYFGGTPFTNPCKFIDKHPLRKQATASIVPIIS